MQAYLSGGILDGQHYEVPEGTTKLKLSKDVSDLSKGYHLYEIDTDGVFNARGTYAGTLSAVIETK